ncbi:MAG TPA: M28 family peptidase [Thermoanaerobaculia bacterium]|nr:M28 family peptidase [Thermoanaerobaculia bacterium]
MKEAAPAPERDRDRRVGIARGVALSIALLACPASAAAADDVADLRADVERLAAPELGGRLTGTEGERAAAAFLAEELRAIGARPLPGADDLLVPFEFTAGARDRGSTLRLEGQPATEWGSGSESRQVQALSFSDDGEVSGEVVFAGYGIKVPDDKGLAYDSFFGLDLAGKIVIVLRYFPEDAGEETRAVLSRYAGLRYKAMHAREAGAAGLIVITGPRSPNAGELVPMTFDTAIAGSGVVAASITGDVAGRLFAAAGRDLAETQAALDTGNPHVGGFPLAGVRVTLDVAIERERRQGHNVVGVLPPRAGAPPVERPWLLLGAHYDHLGEGRHGNSLARKGEAGQIHRGADDNASGVAAALATAGRLAMSPGDRGVVVALWSGEELGLLGSTDFVRRPALAPESLVACLNFDMVGRARDNKLVVQGVGSSPAWRRLVEQANVPVGFDLQLQDDPQLPTDSASFDRAGVPCLNFFTGGHEDYHRPSDTPEKLNYDDLARVVDLASNVGRRLLTVGEPIDFTKVEPRIERGPATDGVRAFTGTIPDYTTEVEGLMLAGVIEGGPADQAGLAEGDVIVELGGRRITNIYDYTYALEAVKVGVPLQVVYLRAGERREATITPRARS